MPLRIESAIAQFEIDPVSNGLVVLPVHRCLARAGSRCRVQDQPGVLELAERNDAEEHGNQDKRHDEDGLQGRLPRSSRSRRQRVRRFMTFP